MLYLDAQYSRLVHSYTAPFIVQAMCMAPQPIRTLRHGGLRGLFLAGVPAFQDRVPEEQRLTQIYVDRMASFLYLCTIIICVKTASWLLNAGLQA